MATEQDILVERSVGFVVIRVEMDNYASARFNDLLCIESEIVELKQIINKSKQTMSGQYVNKSSLCQFIQYETTSYS